MSSTNGSSDWEKWRIVVLLALGFITGSGGTLFGNQYFGSSPSQQLHRLEDQIEKRLEGIQDTFEKIERRLDRLETNCGNLSVNDINTRLLKVEWDIHDVKGNIDTLIHEVRKGLKYLDQSAFEQGKDN